MAQGKNNYERFTMKFVRPLVAVTGLAVAFSLGACGTKEKDTHAQSEVVECDAGDQVERDDDCGYYDQNQNWVWYSWVVQGQTSYSEPGFQKVEQEESSHGSSSHKKSKKSVKLPNLRKNNKPAPKAPGAPVVPASPGRAPIVTQPKVEQPVQRAAQPNSKPKFKLGRR